MIIDEKGILFGKINIIDFLAIVFILALLPMFWYGYKIINKQPPEVAIPTDYKAKYEQLQAERDNFLKRFPRAEKYF